MAEWNQTWEEVVLVEEVVKCCIISKAKGTKGVLQR